MSGDEDVSPKVSVCKGLSVKEVMVEEVEIGEAVMMKGEVLKVLNRQGKGAQVEGVGK